MDITCRDTSDAFKPFEILWFVILAFSFAWAIMVPASLTHLGVIHIHIPGGLRTSAQFTPALAALIVAGIGGRVSLKKLFGGIVRLRVSFRWYLLALVVPLMMVLAEIAGYDLLARPIAKVGAWYEWPLLILILTPLCLGEEIGWRGIFLDRLIRRCSLMSATIIMALVWGLWHLPFYLAGSDIQQYAIFMLGIVPVCALFTLLYVYTRSVLLCAMLHASLDASAPFWLADVPSEHNICAWSLFTGMAWVAGIPALILLAKRDKKASLDRMSPPNTALEPTPTAP